MDVLALPAGRFADERADFHPRSWLTKYRQTSVGYLTKMFLFYHGIGVVLLLVGSPIIEGLIPDYEHPSLPRSLSDVLAAGPLEETIFFWIPFYVFGNAYSVLVTGAVWVAFHVLNTPTLETNTLAYGNLLFAAPSLFFSLRTWVSGRGWFSVLTHSAWNGIFFGAGCATDGFECVLVEEEAIIWIPIAAALTVATYALYKRKESKERQRLAA